ncbi:MAG: TrkH family potassium uptake protein [Planctomycetota bacterium]|jgi:trk system potassium uptake protein TrkH
MNIRYVLKHFGLLLLTLSGVLLGLAAAFFVTEALLRHDVSPAARRALLMSGLMGALLGGSIWWVTRKGAAQLGRREALLLVAASWLIGAAFAGLPFFLWANLPESDAADGHPFRHAVNCYFEAMSGLTTTGATVLGAPYDIEAIPRSLLLWRAFTQWIGGLGIVVLFVAVLPSLGVGGKRLFRVEAPGPAPEGLQPQIRHTARVLLYIYLVLTAAEFLALWAAGMPAYDAVCHTFTTLATGGFSTRNASTGAFDSKAIDIVVIFFMVLAGVNFGLYFALIRRKFRSVLSDPELRTYLALLAIGSLIIVLCLLGQSITTTTARQVEASTGPAIRHGLFTTVSIATTTGFCSADFNAWPFVAKAVLVTLMFIGGSAGSTAGGIKVIRVWVACKVMFSEVERVFRPQVVRPVRVGSAIIDEQLKLGTITYVLGIVLLFAVGSAGVMLFEQGNAESSCDYATAATASVACLCTIGPGLAKVGALEHYGWMTPYSKMLLSLMMALGRLEVFAIIVLFAPRFWRED